MGKRLGDETFWSLAGKGLGLWALIGCGLPLALALLCVLGFLALALLGLVVGQ